MIHEVKYKGETFKFDSENADDMKEMVRLVSAGLEYDKSAKGELGNLRKELDQTKGYINKYNQRLNNIKAGTEPIDDFLNDLESLLGKKLTVKEKRDLANEYEEDSAEINSLKKEIAELKKGFQNTQVDLLSRDIQNVHNQLAAKYNGKDGFPKYSADDVQKYIDENELYGRDLGKLYEDAYSSINRESIVKAAREGALTRGLREKREGVNLQNGGGRNLSLADKPIDIKQSVHGIAQQLKERANSGELSFETDE